MGRLERRPCDTFDRLTECGEHDSVGTNSTLRALALPSGQLPLYADATSSRTTWHRPRLWNPASRWARSRYLAVYSPAARSSVSPHAMRILSVHRPASGDSVASTTLASASRLSTSLTPSPRGSVAGSIAKTSGGVPISVRDTPAPETHTAGSLPTAASRGSWRDPLQHLRVQPGGGDLWPGPAREVVLQLAGSRPKRGATPNEIHLDVAGQRRAVGPRRDRSLAPSKAAAQSSSASRPPIGRARSTIAATRSATERSTTGYPSRPRCSATCSSARPRAASIEPGLDGQAEKLKQRGRNIHEVQLPIPRGQVAHEDGI